MRLPLKWSRILSSLPSETAPDGPRIVQHAASGALSTGATLRLVPRPGPSPASDAGDLSRLDARPENGAFRGVSRLFCVPEGLDVAAPPVDDKSAPDARNGCFGFFDAPVLALLGLIEHLTSTLCMPGPAEAA